MGINLKGLFLRLFRDKTTIFRDRLSSISALFPGSFELSRYIPQKYPWVLTACGIEALQPIPAFLCEHSRSAWSVAS